MRPLARLIALVRADIPVAELDPFRLAGADAYTLIDDAPPATWQRLAAWNAFIHQIYGDNLLAASEAARYVPADTALMVRVLYGLVAAWLERVRQLAADPSCTLTFSLPSPLPGWHTALRSTDELKGMRATLEAARTRAASDLQALAGTAPGHEELRTRLVGIDSTIETVDTLWVGRRSDELRGAIGDALASGLEGANELGQLLAQPSLVGRFAR